MSLQKDEETVKPSIQDRLQSVATRSKEIFASWPIICLSIILILFILPEIINCIVGREIINIFPDFTLEIKINLVLGSSMLLFTAMQYMINKSLFRIEQQRNQPFLSADMDINMATVIIENSGGGIAWGCEVSIKEIDKDKPITRNLRKIYPRSREEIPLRGEIALNEFTVIEVNISYYLEEKENKKIEWVSTFSLTPTVRWR